MGVLQHVQYRMPQKKILATHFKIALPFLSNTVYQKYVNFSGTSCTREKKEEGGENLIPGHGCRCEEGE